MTENPHRSLSEMTTDELRNLLFGATRAGMNSILTELSSRKACVDPCSTCQRETERGRCHTKPCSRCLDDRDDVDKCACCIHCTPEGVREAIREIIRGTILELTSDRLVEQTDTDPIAESLARAGYLGAWDEKGWTR